MQNDFCVAIRPILMCAFTFRLLNMILNVYNALIALVMLISKVYYSKYYNFSNVNHLRNSFIRCTTTARWKRFFVRISAASNHNESNFPFQQNDKIKIWNLLSKRRYLCILCPYCRYRIRIVLYYITHVV